MRHGFIKVAAVTPQIKLADCKSNSRNIIELIDKAHTEGVHLVVFPELTVTGATCQDLFFQNALIDEAISESIAIASNVPRNIVAVWGFPYVYCGKLYNCAMVASDGHILGIVPQRRPSKGMERWFSSYEDRCVSIVEGDDEVFFGNKQIFSCSSLSEFRFCCEIGSDFFESRDVLDPAAVIAHLSSEPFIPSLEKKRKAMLEAGSSQLICGLISANAGRGESSTDLVFIGSDYIFENGECLAFSELSENNLLVSEIDVKKIGTERRTSGFFISSSAEKRESVMFDIEMGETMLTRHIQANPFIPEDEDEREILCSNTIRTQALGLIRRFEHTHSSTVVLGLSGGLDSTLALLVAVTAFDMMGLSRNNIICVTLPCFGTTEKTKSNAVVLAQTLGCSISTIDIGKSVKQHFEDIGHAPDSIDAAYENAQARERTQVLMDLANMNNGLVIGTGDLSELALGWATYNGDHMSMYSVNASIPKTLVKALVKHYADSSDNEILIETLYSILETPISPELIPGQVTEDIVGPYELHDFFLYHILKWGSTPGKVFRLARYAFGSDYTEETIEKWLRTFLKRFFAQQFKRSCSADGPKVTELSLSPRGDWKMPSDANNPSWMRELDFSLD